jgi:hypothetical protein
MRRTAVLVAAIAALAAPIAAHANSNPTTGTRIGLFAAPATFAANTPFYVTQGFTCEAGKTACLNGSTHFDFYVDGIEEPSTTDLTFDAAGNLLSKFNLTNFARGLPSGEHVLHGEWYWLGSLSQEVTVTVDFV